MKLVFSLVLAVTALTLGATAASAYPDGYQPQLTQPDALDRYLLNNASEERPDALARYLRNNPDPAPTLRSAGAAAHPDSRAVRPSFAAEATPTGGDGRNWTIGIAGALGGALLASFAIVGASSIRGRSRLVLR
jgi:hypothetical protein